MGERSHQCHAAPARRPGQASATNNADAPVCRLPSATHCLIPAKPYAESKTRLAPALTPEERATLSRRLLLHTVRLARAVIGSVVVVSRDLGLLEEVRAEGAWGLVEETPGLNPALTQAAHFAADRGAAGVLVLPADLPLLTAADLEAMLAYIAPKVPPSPQPSPPLGAAFPKGGCALPSKGEGAAVPSPLGGEGRVRGEPRHVARISKRTLTLPALERGSAPEPSGEREHRARDEGRPTVVVAPCRHGTGTNALLIYPPGLIPFAFGPDSFAAHCAAARAAGVEPIIYRSDTIALDLDTPEDLEAA
jgi:2-phospho-L-lactate guanylyltransferase (CobY/MobA/RfbA family)